MKSFKVKHLPETISEESLSLHFSQFGIIKNVFLKNLQEGKFAGTAFITLESDLSYEKIINEGAVIGVDKITIEKLTHVPVEDLAQRKICLFGVPKSYKSRKLKKIFEIELGNVENAYIRKTRSKLYNYGFVTFLNVHTAQRALRQGVVVVNDIKEKRQVELEIKKFFTKNEKNNRNFIETENFQNIAQGNIVETKVQNQVDRHIEGSQRENIKNYQTSLNQIDFMKQPKLISEISQNPSMFKNRQDYPQNRRIQRMSKEEEELIYLSQFGFMSPRKLKSYIQTISDNLQQRLSYTKIQQLELFFFNKKFKEMRRGMLNRMLKSKKLQKKINDNHCFNNIRLNRKVRRTGTGIVVSLINRGRNNSETYFSREEQFQPRWTQKTPHFEF